MAQRRSKKGPVSDGGWNAFVISVAGMSSFDPSTNFALRANGADGWFGWPTSSSIESLRQSWLNAADVAEQNAICEKIQKEAFDNVTYIPVGATNIFNVVSKRVRNYPTQLATFYNVDIG